MSHLEFLLLVGHVGKVMINVQVMMYTHLSLGVRFNARRCSGRTSTKCGSFVTYQAVKVMVDGEHAEVPTVWEVNAFVFSFQSAHFFLRDTNVRPLGRR